MAKIVANSSWLVSDRIIRLGVGVIIGIFVARYLGPGKFGVLNYVMALSSIAAALIPLGLDSILIRDFNRHPEKSSELLSSALAVRAIVAFGAYFCTVGTAYLLNPGDLQILSLAAILSVGLIFLSTDTFDLWFQSITKSKYSVLAKNIAFTLVAVLRIALLVIGADLVWFAIAIALEGALGSILLSTFFFRQKYSGIRFSWKPRFATVVVLLKESWPAIVSGFAIMLYMRVDQLMIAAFAGAHEVGLYSAALRFSEVWYFIPGIIVNSVLPTLTRLRESDPVAYSKRLLSLYRIFVTVAYGIALVMVLVASPMIALLLGPEYAKSAAILSVHGWATVFVFLGVGASIWTVNESKLVYTLVQTLSGLALNIALNAMLIPALGGLGAALATLVSQAFASVLVNGLIPPLRPLFFIQLKSLAGPFGGKRE